MIPRFVVTLLVGLATLPAARSQTNYAYQPLPTVSFESSSINNKGQVAGSKLTDSGPVLYLWLPTPDYGLEAGVHSYPVPANIPGTFNVAFGIDVKDFADNGTVYLARRNETYMYFYRGQFTALFGDEYPDRSDLFYGINMDDNGVIYGNPETVDRNRDTYVKVGPEQPRINYFKEPDEFERTPNPYSQFLRTYGIGRGNKHGIHTALSVAEAQGTLAEGGGTENFKYTGYWNGSNQWLAFPGDTVDKAPTFFEDINNKNQLVTRTYIRLGATAHSVTYYLPAPDYGKEAGVHTIGNPSAYHVERISGNGELFSSGPVLYSLAEDRFVDCNELVSLPVGQTIERIHDINDSGQILVGAINAENQNSVAILQPSAKLEILVTPRKPSHKKDEVIEIEIKLTHRSGESAVYRFGEQLFSLDPAVSEQNPAIFSFDNIQAPQPVTLNPSNREWSYTFSATALRAGVVNLKSTASVTPASTAAYELEAEAEIVVSPLTLDIDIRNNPHTWELTTEDLWGDRAKAVNAKRREEEKTPYKNLIEIEMVVTNTSSAAVENVNLPSVRNLLRYIKSTNLSDPGVPLQLIRLYEPGGNEVDLTTESLDTEMDPITLNANGVAGNTATFAWVVEAYQIDPEVEKKSYALDFTPLVLGTFQQKEIRVTEAKPFEILRQPIIVNVTSDDRDADPNDGIIDVDLDTDGEQISLRAAIEYANELPGKDRIEFDIPGEGVPEIKLGEPPEGTNIMATGIDDDLFPYIFRSPEGFLLSLGPANFTITSALKSTDKVEIDGTTQSAGYVLLTGQDLINSVDLSETKAFNCLEIAGGDSVIKGLVINRFPGMGLVLTEKGGNRVTGNIIGMDPTGMIAFGNGSLIRINKRAEPRDLEDEALVSEDDADFANPDYKIWHHPVSRLYAGGILVNSASNIVGGMKAEDRNLFSGHGRIMNRFEISKSTIERFVTPFVSDVFVSGSRATNNEIVGNYVGTNAMGLRSNEGFTINYYLSEVVSGILVNNSATGTIVRNNLTPAIYVENAHNTQVLDNQIGLPTETKGSIDRKGVIFNEDTGSVLKANNIAGTVLLVESGIAQFANNTIEDEKSLEIIKSHNFSIHGNRLGVDAEGNHNEGSHYWTVSMYGSTGIKLGGANPGESNTIAMTGFDGYPNHKAIEIWDRQLDGTNGVRLLYSGNEYVAHPSLPSSNKGLVVDLDNDGVDPIDFGDLDGKQNYPRLASVSNLNGIMRFEGNLDSHFGGKSYHIDIYKTDTPLPSGHGGSSMSYVTRGTVVTDLAGFGQFDILIPYTDYSAKDYFTATATLVGGGETSEFSGNRGLNDNYLKENYPDLFGDRNADGLDDVDQANVASFAAANGAATTIEVSAAINTSSTTVFMQSARTGFSPQNDLDPTLGNVEVETQASLNAPVRYSYSNGILTFGIPNLSAGASVSVRLILADDARPDTLWVMQVDNTWTDTIPASIEGNQVILTLTDGGPGDRDGIANGQIIAALGPATALPPLPELEFTITKEADSHTLSWPLPYSNATPEFSPDLSHGSWAAMGIDFPIDSENERWEISLPNFQNDLFSELPQDRPSSGFYRLRYNLPTNEVANVPYHAWLRNQLETEYGLTGGAWVTGSTESEAMSKVFTPESVTRSDFLVEDQPFVWGLNLKNAVAPSNSWEDFVHVKAHEPIQSGDVLLVVAWVRGVDLGEGQPTILHAFELADPPYTGVAYHQVATSSEWTQYLIPMEATLDLPTSWYKIHLGYAVQEIEVGGVAILNYGNKYTIDQLPKLNVP